MRMSALVVAILGASLLLSACAAATPEPTSSSGSAPTTVAGASSIQEVWEKVGCEEDDPLGTRGIIDATPPKPPVVHAGTCTPMEDGDLAFFYELSSPDAARDWLESGALEVGATDAVFIDGAVVILATDAATAAEFADQFESVD